MINLLPPSYKRELLQEQKWRIILNLEIFLFAFLIALSLILLTVRISVGGLDKAQQILTESERKVMQLEQERAKVLGIEDLEQEVKQINGSLSKLNSFYQEEMSLIWILEKTAEVLPSASYFTRFSYQKASRQNLAGGEINLSGFCPDRQALFQLKENLESQKNFKDIYFPSSNWLNPNNFTFSFKLNLDR